MLAIVSFFDTVAETESRLASLAHVPMLICWGMHDFVFDVQFSQSVD